MVGELCADHLLQLVVLAEQIEAEHGGAVQVVSGASGHVSAGTAVLAAVVPRQATFALSSSGA